jgi:hypothetical protein
MPAAGAIIGAAGSIGGGMLAANAARDAANTQARAGVYSSDVARQTALDQIGAQAYATAPGRNIGTLGLYQLASMLGIDPRQAFPDGMGSGYGGAAPSGSYAPGGSDTMHGGDYARDTAESIANSTFLGSLTTGNRPDFGITGLQNTFDAMGGSGPMKFPAVTGTDPRSLIPGMPAPGAPGAEFGYLTRAPTLSDLQMDPSYKFRLDQNLGAIENSAAARGMQLSGSTLKDLSRFSQDYASQEYGNAYNRYTGQQSDLFNRMASLAGIGQTASQATGATAANALGQAGQTIGNNALGIGNSLAAGQVGSANAINSGIQGATNAWQNYQLQQALFNKPAGS